MNIWFSNQLKGGGSEEAQPPPEYLDGEIPTPAADDIDIPNSTTLWRVDPRPAHSAEVRLDVATIEKTITPAWRGKNRKIAL